MLIKAILYSLNKKFGFQFILNNLTHQAIKIKPYDQNLDYNLRFFM